MIGLLISLIVLCVVVGVVFWLLTMLPIPQPLMNIIKVCIVLICLLYFIGMLPNVGWSHPFYGHY
jgi:hypothetical protein